MNQLDLAQHTIQGLLRTDEQLLWWERPKIRYIKKPMTLNRWIILITNTIISSIFAFLALVLFLYFLRFLYIKEGGNIIRYFPFFLLGSFLAILPNYLFSFIGNMPRYYKRTLYAITNARILIIVTPPGSHPVVLEYFPQEIGQLESITRPDGSGIIIFSTPRQMRPGRYGANIVLPGSFVGISNVQYVTELLLQLKARSE